jgi:hypothetical protein
MNASCAPISSARAESESAYFVVVAVGVVASVSALAAADLDAQTVVLALAPTLNLDHALPAIHQYWNLPQSQCHPKHRPSRPRAVQPRHSRPQNGNGRGQSDRIVV